MELRTPNVTRRMQLEGNVELGEDNKNPVPTNF
jgi:hypothetical protein